MKERSTRILTCVLAAAVSLAGCRGARHKLHYLGDADLQHYKEVATKIEHTNVCSERPDEFVFTREPRRIRDRRKDEIQDIRLGDAIRKTLANSEIIRVRAQFLNPGNPLLLDPNSDNNSVHDPAIQESQTLLGQGVQGSSRGLEDALSDFDARVTTRMLWGRNETVQNNRFNSGGLAPGTTLYDESGQFTSRLEKPFADGSNFSINHNWNYSLNNVPARLFGSVYTGLLQFEYRRPMWAGSGTEYTRIAGPIGTSLQALVPRFQGVVLARIDNDISLAQFETNVRNLLKDVEDLYWELYLAYRVYHSEAVARDSARKIWSQIDARGRDAAAEAQSRDNYYEARGRAENALSDLYSIEAQLRRLLGLPVNDGTVLRPVDDPIVAEYEPNWHVSLAEALTRRVELRRQKWRIKRLELEKIAAKSWTRPRLDFISNYQVNAFGNKLFGQSDRDGGRSGQGLGSAYETLTQGNQTGWNLGVELTLPIGFRQAHTRVLNIERRISKARVALAAQEHEISHELAHVFRELDRWYQTAISAFNRRRAAQRRVQHFEVLLDTVRADDQARQILDLTLRAQISLSQAEISYYRSISEYNKSLADLHYRKGTLLGRNQVHLAEGMWSPEAYDEALRRAWARSHAHANHRVYTEPGEFAADCPCPPILNGSPPAEGGLPELPGDVLPPPPPAPPAGNGQATPPPAENGQAMPAPPGP